MVIFHGEKLPGDRRTARLSVRARRCGDRFGRCRVPVGAGQETAADPQLQAMKLTPPHELPPAQRLSHEDRPGRNGPARRGAPLESPS
jgi:hypothetical protein